MNASTGARFVGALAAVLLLASAGWSRVIPGSGLAGSPHDFTRRGNGPYEAAPGADMCNFCHVAPSGSLGSGSRWADGIAGGANAGPQGPEVLDSLPLWNHKLVSASYRMYENGRGAPTRGAKASQAAAEGMTPGSTSLICLGCHDGSVATNLHGNSAMVIGKDNNLTNHHPVGFNYEAVASMDREIRSPDMAYLTANTTVRDHLYGPGYMECGTCHSVHNTGNSGESLLWRSDVQSRLCLTCHDKGLHPGLP